MTFSRLFVVSLYLVITSFAWDDYNLSQTELFFKHQEEHFAKEAARAYESWWDSGGKEEDVPSSSNASRNKAKRAQRHSPSSSSSYSLQELSSGRNSSIIHGYFTLNGVTTLIGNFTSNISAVIDEHYLMSQYMNKNQLAADVRAHVWLNSTKLNYITITGTYTADIPIVMPHMTILVLDDCIINAHRDFPTNTEDYDIYYKTIKGNPNPNTNTASITSTNWALIVFHYVYFSGIISPGGPSKAILNCSAMPEHDISSKVEGPAGIYTTGSGAIYIDGVTVDRCGLDNGNIALYGKSRAEITNSVVANGRTRGIWLIIQSLSVIHDTEVYGSKKFGIDIDADVDPLTVVYRCNIHNNGYQAVFIEQGAVYSVVTDNILSPYNQNGVSFYNNEYEAVVSDHVILNNQCYDNLATGINFGSRATADSHKFSKDSYVIGNTVYNNYIGEGAAIDGWGEQHRNGFDGNGAVHGMYMIGNDDTDYPTGSGLGNYLFKKGDGGIIIVDPMKRHHMPSVSGTAAPVSVSAAPSKYPSRNPTPSPTVDGTISSINVTIVEGVVDSFIGTPRENITIGEYVGSTASELQGFLTKHYEGLAAACGYDPSARAWIWNTNNMPNPISFFILKGGEYVVDTSLELPSETMLVLDGATLRVSESINSISKGVITAESAHFSGVVSPGGVDNAWLDCSSNSNPAGVYIHNSSYFTVEGVTINNCGANVDYPGGIVIFGANDPLHGNSTSVASCRVQNSKRHGVYTNSSVRPIIYKNSISGSIGDGVRVDANTYGVIVTENTISTNGGVGVQIMQGSTVGTVRGNMITSNSGAGVRILNANNASIIEHTVIITNTITNNKHFSVLLEGDESASASISTTVVCGNTINGNLFGMGVRGNTDATEQTMIMDNTDTDGLMYSILSLTNGNNVDGAKGNYIMDPADRMKFDARDDLAPTAVPTVSPSSYPPSPVPTMSPTFGPTIAAAPIVKINIQQKIKAVSYESFMADEVKNKIVLKTTISQTLGNIPQEFIEIISVSPVARRRLTIGDAYSFNRNERSDKNVMSTGISCDYVVSYTEGQNSISGFDDSNASPEDIVNHIESTIQASVEGGTFTSTLVSVASTEGASALENAVVDETPSVSYTVETSETSGSNSSDKKFDPIITGSVIGGALLCFLAFTGMHYSGYLRKIKRFFRKRKKKSVNMVVPEENNDVEKEFHDVSIRNGGGKAQVETDSQNVGQSSNATDLSLLKQKREAGDSLVAGTNDSSLMVTVNDTCNTLIGGDVVVKSPAVSRKGDTVALGSGGKSADCKVVPIVNEKEKQIFSSDANS